MSNFKEMYTRVQNYINDDSSDTLAIIKDSINLKAKEVMRRGLWHWSLRETTITTTSGTQDYYIYSAIDKILDVYEQTTPSPLRRIFIGDFDRLVPRPSDSSGAPKNYMFMEEDRVKAQPSAAGKVACVSTDNQDVVPEDGATMATVYGVVNGVDRTENIYLSATNYVSTTGLFTKLYSITTDLAAVGTLSFTEPVVGTEFLMLYPTETERTYKKFKFYPVPNGTYTMYVRYQVLQPKLIYDSDVLISPSRFAECVIELVIGDLLMKQGDVKAAPHIQMGEKILNEMKQNEDLMFDYVPQISVPSGRFTYTDNSYPF